MLTWLCNQLCRKLHDHDRSGEVEDGIAKTATVVERHGGITGYASAIGFFAHAVGETDKDLMALIGAAPLSRVQEFLFQQAIMRASPGAWKISLVFQMTLMTTGL